MKTSKTVIIALTTTGITNMVGGALTYIAWHDSIAVWLAYYQILSGVCIIVWMYNKFVIQVWKKKNTYNSLPNRNKKG